VIGYSRLDVLVCRSIAYPTGEYCELMLSHHVDRPSARNKTHSVSETPLCQHKDAEVI
jgi:hypothetical protein